MNRFIRTFLAAGLLAAARCGGPPDLRPLAEDPVCLAKGDLGCVRVRVDEKTPRSTYQGKTYFFCEERCRVEFDKDPQKYAASGTGR